MDSSGDEAGCDAVDCYPIRRERGGQREVAAPANLREGATVVKWKPDYTYDTLKKGTNRLVCYDRSGTPGQQPFSVECTSTANLDRVAQNIRIDAMGEKKQAMLDAAETVQPALEEFYAALSNEQKARFNTLGRQAQRAN